MNCTDEFGGRVNKDVNSNSPGALGSAQSAAVMSPVRAHSLESASGFVSWSKGWGWGWLLESQGRDSTHSTFQKHVAKLTDSKIKSGWKDILI